ncbi:MAG: lysine--tRNA ligase [Candidatus Aenigmarchaeota archaeon ex4484_224]|nr:MAG: lysine--tRNA ligase [Candidatus Aenigmarchaeota archaeon ex4484_224]
MEEVNLEKLREERIKKLEKLRKLGLDPFAITKFERTHTSIQLREQFEQKIKNDEKLEDIEVKIAGRIFAIRRHGKIWFIDLKDGYGRIQIAFEKKVLEKKFELLDLLDMGDIIGIVGYPGKTVRGELTVWAKDFQILAKALRPLPSKWYGLKDAEKRYRQRYVDFLVNEKARETLIKRSKIIKAIREFLESKGFMEVETPILQPIYGGAFAKPFITHHNALDIDLYLRIAPELYLKRLIVGNFEKIYEIGKNFRNEGIDSRHNPEFTSLECYWAYADYNDIMNLTEEMIKFVTKKVLGSLEIEFKGNKIDLSKPWKRVSLVQIIKEYTGIDFEKDSKEKILQFAKEKGLEVNEKMSKGDLMDLFFEEFVQPNLIQPTFVIDYPVEISPLAKRKKENPEFTERFELFIGGLEIANAFSELNDPIDQRKRFEEQLKRRKEGLEYHEMDEDFIRALEYGMPPTGGLGIGIDRLVMLLTNNDSIREVIAFPTLRPERREKNEKKN